jgi:hypothetical protein
MARMKDLEELVGLQAKAIEALQQAVGALRIALEVIQKSHAEKGTQEKIVFVPGAPATPYNPPTPVPQPYFGESLPAQNVLQNVQSSLANFQSGMMGYETELPL